MIELYQDMPFEYLTNDKMFDKLFDETRLYVVTREPRKMIPKLTKLNHQLNLEGSLKIYLSEYV